MILCVNLFVYNKSSHQDALRAYDDSIVLRKGESTTRADLNLPGEWAFKKATSALEPFDISRLNGFTFKPEKNKYKVSRIKFILANEMECGYVFSRLIKLNRKILTPTLLLLFVCTLQPFELTFGASRQRYHMMGRRISTLDTTSFLPIQL